MARQPLDRKTTRKKVRKARSSFNAALKKEERFKKAHAKHSGSDLSTKSVEKYGKISKSVSTTKTRLWRTKLGKKWQGARTGRKGG